MKNIQVIDGAVNSIFEVYEVDYCMFDEIFADGKDVVFFVDLQKYNDFTKEENVAFWEKFYSSKKDKKMIYGIHGTLHLEGSCCRRVFFKEGKEALVLRAPIHE